jgi:hypothetical protein
LLGIEYSQWSLGELFGFHYVLFRESLNKCKLSMSNSFVFATVITLTPLQVINYLTIKLRSTLKKLEEVIKTKETGKQLITQPLIKLCIDSQIGLGEITDAYNLTNLVIAASPSSGEFWLHKVEMEIKLGISLFSS